MFYRPLWKTKVHADGEDKLGSQIATSGQNREMTVINESILYKLTRQSNGSGQNHYPNSGGWF